jgi:peptidoglycan biosynthesis protein MviN/MurJ (putative lipid II flippase)
MPFSLTRLAPAVATLTLLSLANSASAFLVELALASTWGNNSTVDAFRVTHSIVIFGLQSFYVQALPLTLVPWFTARLIQHGEASAWHALHSIRARLTLALLPILAAVILLSGPIVTLLAPGLDPAGRAAAILLLPAMTAAFAIVLHNGVLAAGLAARNIFWPGPVSQLLLNLAICAAVLTRDPQWLAAAVVAGALLGVALHRLTTPPLPAESRPAPAPMRWSEILKPALPIVAAGFATQAWSMILYRHLILFGPGAAASFGYAFRLTALVHIPAAMFCTVLLPSLSMIQQQNPAAMPRAFRKAILVVLALTVPLSILLGLAARPLVHALYGSGAWQGDALAAIATMLQILAVSAPTGALMMICQRFLAASWATHYMFLASLGSLAIGIVGSLLTNSPADVVWVWVVAAWFTVIYLASAAWMLRNARPVGESPPLAAVNIPVRRPDNPHSPTNHLEWR